MGEVVNLNKARKAKARAAKETTATANRALHGRTRAQKQAEAAEKAKRDALLDGAEREEYGPPPELVMPAKAGISRGERLPRPMGGWVYIMASRRDGMLYIGVTAHLAARVDQHRRDLGSSYCRRYGIHTLVYAEPHELIEQAIAREKALKAWKRAWKIELIEGMNPRWDDLFDRIA